MREILYRAKPYSGKWVYGYYAKKRDWADSEAHYILMIGKDFIGHEEFMEIIVDPETVGQYTGLHDKKRRKIFEGDIVRFEKSGVTRSVIFDEHLAEFEFSKYDPVENPDGWCLCCDHDFCEVIGNIHDNPELLKGDSNVPK